MDTKPQTYEDLHRFASINGLDATKALLRKYVKDDEPDDFMPGFTTRAMCRAAAAGLEGLPVDQVPSSYMDTKHGSDLYWHMHSDD
ncbi:MAG: hypothetical protein ABI574_19310 [Burkholderiales bacterium]